jgi:hypothetical protein
MTYRSDAGGTGQVKGYEGSAEVKRIAEEARRKREEARQRGLGAQEELVGGAREGLATFRGAAADRQRQIRYGAAQGLAAAAPTGRMAAGGGFLGAAGQAGLSAEMTGIEQASRDAAEERGLRQAASQAELSAAEYAAQSGSEDEDYAQAMSQAEAAIQSAITSNRSWYGDDEEAMDSAVRAEINKIRMISPKAAQEIEDKYLKTGGSGFEQIYD